MNNNTLNNFMQFCDSEVRRLQPKADQSLQKGTIIRMQSYIADFNEKFIELNSSVIDKANEILKKDNGDDVKELLMDICKQSLSNFTSKYKPQ